MIKTIFGEVIKGKQKGRTLGFPTANIKVDIKPASGVYAGEVILDNSIYKAAVFVPEVGDFIEAHILDFSGDIYGKKIEIIIGKKIREVRKFQSDSDLREQIEFDLEEIKKRD